MISALLGKSPERFFLPYRPVRGAPGAMSTDLGPDSTEAEVATDLGRRIAAGDSAAETALVERYSRGLLYLLKRQGVSPELADDLHQETFRIVIERLRQRELDDPAGLAGFLRGIARNLATAEYRKAARRKTEADPEGLEQAVNPAPGQLQNVLLNEEANIVRRLISELPTDRDQQLLMRFYVAEEEKESICSDLGLDSLHFNRVLFRARSRFKELLERFQARQGPAAPAS